MDTLTRQLLKVLFVIDCCMGQVVFGLTRIYHNFVEDCICGVHFLEQ